jgi:hypothetical protein
LAEGLPLLRDALREVEAAESADTPVSRNLILESNSLLQFWAPTLYLMVIDPRKADFKESARGQLDRASAIVLRGELADGTGAAPDGWNEVPLKLMVGKQRFVHREGEALPDDLISLVRAAVLGDEVRAAG